MKNVEKFVHFYVDNHNSFGDLCWNATRAIDQQSHRVKLNRSQKTRREKNIGKVLLEPLRWSGIQLFVRLFSFLLLFVDSYVVVDRNFSKIWHLSAPTPSIDDDNKTTQQRRYIFCRSFISLLRMCIQPVIFGKMFWSDGKGDPLKCISTFSARMNKINSIVPVA